MNSSTPAEVWSCIAALARKFIAKLWVLTICTANIASIRRELRANALLLWCFCESVRYPF
jgi:hypothetical protein